MKLSKIQYAIDQIKIEVRKVQEEIMLKRREFEVLTLQVDLLEKLDAQEEKENIVEETEKLRGFQQWNKTEFKEPAVDSKTMTERAEMYLETIAWKYRMNVKN